MNHHIGALRQGEDSQSDGSGSQWCPPAAGADPTVFVIDSDPVARRTFRRLVTSVGLAVEEFAMAETFLDAYQPRQWGCLLLEIRLPGMSGLDLQSMLAEVKNTLPMIMVTSFADVPTAVHAVKAGAVDFLQKPVGDQLLLERVQQAIELSAGAYQLRVQRRELLARFGRLSPRERQVMKLVATGRATKEIAAATGTSPRTVEAHRANMMTKIGVHSQAELIRFALQCEVT